MAEYVPLTDEQVASLQRILVPELPTEPAEIDAFLRLFGYDPGVLAEKFQALAGRLIERGMPMDKHALVSEEWVASVPESAAALTDDVRQVVADRAHWMAEAEKARADYAALVKASMVAANYICGCGDWLPEYIRQPMLAALRDAGVDVVDEAKEAVDGGFGTVA